MNGGSTIYGFILFVWGKTDQDINWDIVLSPAPVAILIIFIFLLFRFILLIFFLFLPNVFYIFM